MQGILIALIGALGLAIPPAMNIGTSHGRRLRRIQQEAALLNQLGDDLEPEWRIARLLLRESLWDYALARRRPGRLLVRLVGGFVTSVMITMGTYVAITGNVHSVLHPKNQGNNHHSVQVLALGVALVGLSLYIKLLTMGADSVRARVAALKDPSSRQRRLLAAEVDWVENHPLLVEPRVTPRPNPAWYDLPSRYGDWLLRNAYGPFDPRPPKRREVDSRDEGDA